MALTWTVHCAKCKNSFQLYDDEAMSLTVNNQKPFCSDKCILEYNQKGEKMPHFRISGDIRRAFVVEVKAETLEKAMEMVESGEVPRSQFSLANEYQDGDTEAQDGEEIGEDDHA